MGSEGTACSAWLDDFFATCYADRPVNATFIGVHDHDHALPDFTENGAGDQLARMDRLLEGARTLAAGAPRCDSAADPATHAATVAEGIDVRAAQGFLRTQIREYRSSHFHRGNPSLYTGEAVYSVLSLFLTDHAPLAARMEAATQRMQLVPGFLEQCRMNVRNAPLLWTERALRECDGAHAFLTAGLDRLIQGWGSGAAEALPTSAGSPASSAVSALRAAARVANRAFAELRLWLDTILRHGSSTAHACGEEMLALYLREGHFLEEDGDAIVALAAERMAGLDSRLAREAARAGAATPREVLERLAATHAAPDEYYARFAQVWQEMKRLATSRDLLTWPDAPIRFVPIPVWAREAAPHLYFLHYRSPAAFGPAAVHEHLVPPVEPEQPADVQAGTLRSVNDSVIKLNHVIHHAGIGHHVQNWHARRSGSRIGRIAAVDCASRIALYCGGTMAEGWACYATDLMAEAGALSPLEHCAHMQTGIRMCARAIVDVNLHRGRWSIAECAAFYERRAGMTPPAALAEAVRNSMFPGTALMYLMGTERIHALRRELAAREGFTLRRFHDALLAWGSIPVSLVAAHMTGDNPFVARPAEAAG